MCTQVKRLNKNISKFNSKKRKDKKKLKKSLQLQFSFKGQKGQVHYVLVKIQRLICKTNLDKYELPHKDALKFNNSLLD